MKICVVGAGAIGGLLGAKLAQNNEITLIARGPHLQAIKANGLRVVMNDGTETVVNAIGATDNMRQCGWQDIVVLALKAHQIIPVIDDICSLIGPHSIVLTVQNGLPWWYFQRHIEPYNGYVIKKLDPTGELSAKIDPENILGCIAYPAAEVREPGVIRHVEGVRFPVGELDGSVSQRAQTVSNCLISAGFKCPILEDIRSEIWLKAWGNLSFNPISALTHATLEDICKFPESRYLAKAMMLEAQDIAAKLGVTFRVDIERRINGAQAVGKHKTSMLQDVEAGRTLELEAIIGAVVELGELTSTPTPTISSIYAVCQLLNHMVTNEGFAIRSKHL